MIVSIRFNTVRRWSSSAPALANSYYIINKKPHPINSYKFPNSRAKIKNNNNNNNVVVVVVEDIDDTKHHKLRWFSIKLKACVSGGFVNEGKGIHGMILRSGFVLDSHLWVSLINFYAKCGCLGYARNLLDEMPHRDVVSWTTLISGYVSHGYQFNAFNLFCEMRRQGVRPNEFCLSTVLKGCVMQLDLRFGVQVQAEVTKVGVLLDVFVASCLVDLYSKCGVLRDAAKLFYSVPEQSAVSWNALLNGYAQLGDTQETFRLFCNMTKPEMKFSKFTLCTVLKGCVNSGDVGGGKLLHCIAIKTGSESGDFLGCSLVDLYSKSGLVDDAILVFSKLECVDTMTWSAMIACLAQHGRRHQAAELFRSMMRVGLTPNQHTLATLANVATSLGILHCRTIHAYVYKYGFETDNVVCNAMITMYLALRLFNDGYRVFYAMSNRDIVSWNSLLSGFHGDATCDQGIPIFKQMLVEGFTPSTSTYISTVGLCSSLMDIKFGRQVHAYIIKDNLSRDNNIGTTLIDMYAKCSCLKDAEVIFNRLYPKDTVTWTAIMNGYAQNRQEEKAIECFNQMQKEGIRPNVFTVSTCLKACSGIASLVNGKQLHLFTIKSGNSGDKIIASGIIDMYGKCGCIYDAELIFDDMDDHDTVLWNTLICEYVHHGQGKKALGAFKNMLNTHVLPDGVTFLGILSACRYMGLIEEGWKYFNSMNHIYGITPSNKHYACMIDILASSGRLGEVESLIKQMNVTS